MMASEVTSEGLGGGGVRGCATLMRAPEVLTSRYDVSI